MNIGNYRPDGNIYSVPEVKEMLKGGSGDITELEQDVAQLKTDVTGIGDEVDDIIRSLFNINDDIDTLDNTTVKKINETFSGSQWTCTGFLTNSSKDIEFMVPCSRYDGTYNLSCANLRIVPRFVSGTGYYNNGTQYTSMSASTYTTIVENGTKVDGISSVTIGIRNGGGFVIRIKFRDKITSDSEGNTAITNNTPVCVMVEFTVNIYQ